MLIWLPPSEGKTSPAAGPQLSLAELSFPELTGARQEVLSALERLGDGPAAAKVLKLGAKSAADAALNTRLREAPSAPAINIYTGVLFDALDAATLPPQALQENVWIWSGLFGVLGALDQIPNHRLAIGVNLPPLGPLGTWWRQRLAAGLPDVTGRVILDCRSGGYRSTLPATTANIVDLRVVENRSDGPKVITHMAKKWRGLAARHLLQDTTLGAAATVEDVLGALEQMGKESGGTIETVSFTETKRNRSGGTLTTVTVCTSAAR